MEYVVAGVGIGWALTAAVLGWKLYAAGKANAAAVKLALEANNTALLAAKKTAEAEFAADLLRAQAADSNRRSADVIAGKTARIAELEAELARVLDPRVVGERLRRMLSEGAGAPDAAGEPAGFGRVPFGHGEGS